MKCIKILSLSLVVSLLVFGCVHVGGGSVKLKQQTTCPIMGKTINKQIYTDYEGKRVYFCCKACIDEFSKDPKKYVREFEDEGIFLEKAFQMDDKKGSNYGTDKGDEKSKAQSGCGCCS